jgi:TatD DNase family protein
VKVRGVSGDENGGEGGQGTAPRFLIDSHCHLDQPQFAADRDAVLDRAQAAGVRIIINPGIDLDSSRNVMELADRYPPVYAAVGVHPNDCAAFDDSTVEVLRELAKHPKVVAIGEIGLDYHWKRVPKEQQKWALRAQLALAGEMGLPVILHSRESNADLLWELAQWVPEIRTQRGPDAMLGVLHAFSGGLVEAETAYALGFLISLGGPVTFANARRLHALVPQMRPDRLMLETDAPYLAPHPHRGQRNEPGYIPLIVQAMAALLKMPADAVAAHTTKAAMRCFGLHVSDHPS